MAIIFEYVDIEWAGSIKKLRYYFNSPGLNLIRGENGVGKTTIFNALYWGLFGKVIKKDSTIEPWPSIIDEDYQGTKVKVKYRNIEGKPRIIIHCASYKKDIANAKGKNRLVILADGKVLDELRDKADGWKWIINDLGYTPGLFKSSVLFGQKVKRIMEEDGPTRNKILEEAFEASFITQAKVKVDERLRKSRPELNLKIQELTHINDKILSLQEIIQDAEHAQENFQKTKTDNIRAIKIRISDLGKLHEELENSKVDDDLDLKILKKRNKLLKIPKLNRQELSDKEFKLSLEINRLEGSRDSKIQRQDILKKSFTNLKTKCSICKQPIPPKEIIKQKQKIKEEMASLKGDIQSDNIVIDTVNKDYNSALLQLKSFDKIINKRSKIELLIKRLEGIKDKQGNIRKDIEVVNVRLDQYQDQLTREEDTKFDNKSLKKNQLILVTVQGDKIHTEHKYKELKKKVDIDEWLIKDPLSNSGLKTFVLDAMLQKTNTELIKYESVTGFKIQMGFSPDTKRKDFFIKLFNGTEEIPHADLSGGQMQLADLCIALAIHDTIADNKGCNMQLFDEVFESLSKNNIDKVGDLLYIKSKGKSIHIITHTSFNPTNAKELLLELNSKKQTITAS